MRCPACGTVLELRLANTEEEAAERREAWADAEHEALLREAERKEEWPP